MPDEPSEAPLPKPIQVPAFELPASAALSPTMKAMMATPVDLPLVEIPSPIKFDSEEAYRRAVDLFRDSLDGRFTRPFSEMLTAQFPKFGDEAAVISPQRFQLRRGCHRCRGFR